MEDFEWLMKEDAAGFRKAWRDAGEVLVRSLPSFVPQRMRRLERLRALADAQDAAWLAMPEFPPPVRGPRKTRRCR